MSDELTAAVVEALEDKKGTDIIVLDVRGRSAETDRFILATGRSDRQLKAMAKAVAEVAHRFDLRCRVEGMEAMQWLLVDLGDVVVHLFLEEVRETFRLEKLWASPAAGGQ